MGDTIATATPSNRMWTWIDAAVDLVALNPHAALGVVFLAAIIEAVAVLGVEIDGPPFPRGSDLSLWRFPARPEGLTDARSRTLNQTTVFPNADERLDIRVPRVKRLGFSLQISLFQVDNDVC